MDDLVREIKELIIRSLELEDLSPDDIDTHQPLFGEGLGLDSVDALELGMTLYKKYDVKLEASSEETQKHFQSVATLAEFIRSQKVR